MPVNKVSYFGTVLLDLTGDTVTADKLLKGETAHDKSGAEVIGTVGFSTIYKATTTPNNTLGVDGDIYLKL